PVTFAVLTTVTAFAPLLFVPGIMGKFFYPIPMIVIPIFLVSLVEVLFILPAHLAHSKPPRETGVIGAINRAQARFSARVEQFVQKIYRPFLDLTLRFRYTTLAVSFTLLATTVGLVWGGFVKFNFMPKIEGDEIIASVQMPVGTPVDKTREVTDRLVAEAKNVLEETDTEGDADIERGILSELGASGIVDRGPGPSRSDTGSHLTEVVVSLVPASQRDITSKEFTQRWRQKVGSIAGADTVDFTYDIGPGSGAPVSFELRHPNTETLHRAANRLADQLRTYNGVFDVNNGVQEGKEQLDLTLKSGARALGVTESGLARQVRAAFFGAEVAREQRGRDELRIYVRRPRDERTSESHIENLMIQTPEGGEIPLDQAAHIERDRAATTIEREAGA
ncbi:MAG: efflux RND transporter permease subunit, partial [Bradymonadaceae bacterium]